ncbi:hypothetical protein KDH_02470 [Dictyobacter sp. S3.2.2.5]|uniref:Zinc finger CGNR domain-containing protein n=1 Tax=Dictyobacter halimunensis TaxID=3026934 RepID=A0ABQ6FLH2_9CHLR|nr:hypothetical protein KDH_02470 [Dictyobacter sp. S3.2.2.5]
MDEKRREIGTIALRGEQLCLNFTNTVSWHASDHPHEWIHSYNDLLSWSRHTGMLDEDEYGQLLQAAKHWPTDAAAVLSSALTLREAIYQIFSDVVADHSPQQESLAIFQQAYADAIVHAQLVLEAEGFTFSWRHNARNLSLPLWVIAHSALELLRSQEWRRVKKCPGDGCGWLFVDRSRNQSRRWCNGQNCGNRVRVRQHYQRRRTSAL